MPYAKPILLSLTWTLCTPVAWAQQYPQITRLEGAADLVVIAAVDQIIQPGGKTTPNVTLQLQVAQTLKGAAISSTLTASIAAFSQRAPGPMTFPSSMVGQTGIWFLKSGSNGYQIPSEKKVSLLPRPPLFFR